MTNTQPADQPTPGGDKTSERPAPLLRRSILIVEDDELLQAVLCETLRGAGHQVRVAGSAGEALVSVAKEPPDVVAIDLMAPDMNGRELLSCLRNNPSTRSRSRKEPQRGSRFAVKFSKSFTVTSRAVNPASTLVRTSRLFGSSDSRRLSRLRYKDTGTRLLRTS